MSASVCILFFRRMFSPVTTAFAIVLLFPLAVSGKDVPATGIFLFAGPSGPSYVQVTDLLFNGKTELRLCAGEGPIDRNIYKKLVKTSFAKVLSLQRRADGVLLANTGTGNGVCVVPGNFKFEGDASLSPSSLVDKSTFTATLLGSAPAPITSLPPFSPGSELVMGSATDKERADFLLAKRGGTISALRAYLTSYSASANASQVRTQLMALLDQSASEGLAAYRKSSISPTPAFDRLGQAQKDVTASLELQPGGSKATQILADIMLELTALVKQASGDLQAYSELLAANKDGYAKLIECQRLAAAITAIDSRFSPGVALNERLKSQSSLRTEAIDRAEANLRLKNIDAASKAVAPYQASDGSDPAVSHVLDQLYKLHFDKGAAAFDQAKWAEASAEFRAASAVRPTAEVKAKIAATEANLVSAKNKAAADIALASSRELTDSDPIRAYEVLAELAPGPRALVTEQMSALQRAYVQAAASSAQKLEERHRPIRGLEDESAIRRAYDYYANISALTGDADSHIKQELLAELISSYYVDLGEKYLAKPLSSGVGIGWTYLAEAQQYRPNTAQVRDDMTKNSAAYNIRSKLSIGVLFRDQTSRRDSAGFADQMQEAFATGIESSGLPAKVVLPNTSPVLDPNFQFIGEILQHRTIRSSKKDTLQSEYRSGSREVPNDAWNKADLDFEAANMEMQKTQAALSAAQAKGNKKQMESLGVTLSAEEKKVQQARAKMNGTPKTLSEPIISPYNYTQTSLELTNIVELSFRILDAAGSIIQPPTRVVKGEKPRKFVLLENIKADDTKGLKEIDSPPDETQLLTDVEIEARDAMVKAAHDEVLELPAKVLAQARAKEASGDRDGAGELYILYLNSTASENTPERQAAIRFLSSAFNLRSAANLSASVK